MMTTTNTTHAIEAQALKKTKTREAAGSPAPGAPPGVAPPSRPIMRRAAAGSPAPGGAPGVAPPSRSNTLLLLLRLFSLPLLLCQLLFVAVAVSGASASVVVPAPAPAPATFQHNFSAISARYFSTAILQYSQTWDALVLPEMGSPRARLQAQALLDPAIPPSAVRACCHFGQHGVESLVQKSGPGCSNGTAQRGRTPVSAPFVFISGSSCRPITALVRRPI